jgi:hypothetical protein
MSSPVTQPEISNANHGKPQLVNGLEPFLKLPTYLGSCLRKAKKTQ